jgi:hypothetical protein
MSRMVTATALLMAITSFSSGEELTYHFDMDEPIAWSDVALPWGYDGYLDWTHEDGGRAGKALRITSANRERAVTCEGRALQFNHEPGTPVRIQGDLRIAAMAPQGRVYMRYYDGYVTALAFEAIANDEYDPWPTPIFDANKATGDEWIHFDLKTPPLKQSVLTIYLLVMDPKHDTQDDANAVEYPDVFLDNLQIDTVPSSQLRDPGFEWSGKGGGKSTDWRCSTGGKHVDWRDVLQREDVPEKAKMIHYTYRTFRDTASRPPGHVKHNFGHSVSNPIVGGVSTIILSNAHADAAAASWGIRQTFSYKALGLGPGESAKVVVKIKNTVHDPVKRHWARLMLGCDPNGHILPTKAQWTPETTPNWDEKGWQVQELTVERPKDAMAMTVYFKMRDGKPDSMKGPDGKWIDDPDSKATKPGCKAFADWVVVKVE